MNTAEQLIQNIGLRPSLIRTAVLGVMLDANDALSHAEVMEHHLQPIGAFDRVTVYRVLDWLVAQGLDAHGNYKLLTMKPCTAMRTFSAINAEKFFAFLMCNPRYPSRFLQVSPLNPLN